MKVRSRVWEIQVTFLVIMAIIGWPSSLIEKIRSEILINAKKVGTAEAIQQATLNVHNLDKATWWIFVLGIYKDPRPEYEMYFYMIFGTILVGLFFEKQAINWLTNRWGCTYNKLQKFIELDLRQQAIESMREARSNPSVEQWGQVVPIYDPNRYELHYFYNNFR